MEIKDIVVTAERMEEVRGGANFAGNYSSNGPVVSLVGVRAGNSNGSSFGITNTVVQQNTTTQDAFVEDVDIRSRSFSAVNSQVDLGSLFGRWGR